MFSWLTTLHINDGENYSNWSDFFLLKYTHQNEIHTPKITIVTSLIHNKKSFKCEAPTIDKLFQKIPNVGSVADPELLVGVDVDPYRRRQPNNLPKSSKTLLI